MPVEFRDTFGPPTQVELSTHPPDVGDSWTLAAQQDVIDMGIGSDETCGPSGSLSHSGCTYTAAPAPSGSDYDVAVAYPHVPPESMTGTRGTHLVARWVDAGTFYAAGIYNTAASPDRTIIKAEAGVVTVLASGEFGTPPAGAVATFQLRGDQLTLLVDGVEQLTATDAALAAPGLAGLSIGRVGNTAEGAHVRSEWAFDDFTVTTVDAGPAPEQHSGSAVVSGGGSVSASGTKRASAAAVASAGGTASASGRKTARGSGAASGAGATAAFGTKRATGSALVTGSGASSASGTKRAHQSVSLSGTGATSATGTKRAHGSAAVSATGSTTAAGHPVSAAPDVSDLPTSLALDPHATTATLDAPVTLAALDDRSTAVALDGPTTAATVHARVTTLSLAAHSTTAALDDRTTEVILDG